MNKTATLIILFACVIVIGMIIFNKPTQKDTTINTNTQSVENSQIKDGIQYITINARGGYTPKVSTAKAGIPTKLVIKTNGTYDCSASLVIHSLGYRKILPQTGETVIDVGIPKIGTPLQGVCGMGMYNFLINFL